MQGHSFAKALKGAQEPSDWRRATYYRYWMHMAHGHNNPAHFGIRTKKYKLIFFYGVDHKDVHNNKKVIGRDGNRFFKSTPAGWEFYDLIEDPHEMNNRYRDPQYQKIILSLKTELKRLRKEIGDTDKENQRIRKIINENWDK